MREELLEAQLRLANERAEAAEREVKELRAESRKTQEALEVISKSTFFVPQWIRDMCNDALGAERLPEA